MKFERECHLVQQALRSFAPRLRELPREVADKGGDLGPLTDLDRYVDARLHDSLHAAFPADGWISEESPGRAGGERQWIVDPIDGTREIVAGIPEWAVSVGLWTRGEPSYGWLYNASRDVLWHGGPGLGAWAEGDTRRAVRVREPGPLEALAIAVSRSDLRRGLVPQVNPAPLPIGSIAYKLGLVAAGEIDATVSVTPKNPWDIAGGIPIVIGAGGKVVRLSDGAALTPMDTHALQEGGLVAAHPGIIDEIRRRYSGRR